MKIKLAILSVAVLSFIGCATSVKRGHVVMKTGDDRAHIATGTNEMKVGDHVELYRNQCTGGGGRGSGPRECQKITTGHGEVIQVLSPDYVEVRFPSGTTFAEGDTIEKHQH